MLKIIYQCKTELAKLVADKGSDRLKDLKIKRPKIFLIACDLGDYLYVIWPKKMSPATSELVGVNIAAALISAAKEYLDGLGVSDLAFDVAKADDLEISDDQYFDVVFTKAVVLYLADGKIH